MLKIIQHLVRFITFDFLILKQKLCRIGLYTVLFLYLYLYYQQIKMRKNRKYYIIKATIFSVLFYFFIIISLAFSFIKTPAPPIEEDGITIELEDLQSQIEKLNDLKNSQEDNIERSNNAVNDAMSNEKETDPYDYSDIENPDENYKEQIVKNAISEQEYDKIFKRDDINLPTEEIKKDKEKESSKENKPSNYQGATYIHFFLKNRHKVKIPIPTYQCETFGKVILDIVVNRDGKVINATITSASTNDDCLRQAALRSAKKARFNASYKALDKQKGSVTYIFEAQ